MIVVTSALTPIFLAFPEAYTDEMVIVDNLMNMLFIFDIVINFISAYYDEDYQLIDDPKVSISSILYNRKSPQNTSGPGLSSISPQSSLLS